MRILCTRAAYEINTLTGVTASNKEMHFSPERFVLLTTLIRIDVENENTS